MIRRKLKRCLVQYDKILLWLHYRGRLQDFTSQFLYWAHQSHRQLLDCAAKGNFIDIDPSVSYEIIEGIVGLLPPQKGPPPTQEGTQILEKLCELKKIY